MMKQTLTKWLALLLVEDDALEDEAVIVLSALLLEEGDVSEDEVEVVLMS